MVLCAHHVQTTVMEKDVLIGVVVALIRGNVHLFNSNVYLKIDTTA